MKKGYITNIEQETVNNTDYRRVLYTSEHSQLVVMSIESGDEIGSEVHALDQFIRVEAGTAKLILNESEEYILEGDHAAIIPAGTTHNVVSTGSEALKLYSIYSPPEHKDGLVQATKADDAEVHFDGTTTE